MAGKPTGQFQGQTAANRALALGEALAYPAHRFEHGCMLVDMALAGRELGFLHPAILLAKVREHMGLQGVKGRREVGVGGLLQCAHALNELLVNTVHRPVAQEQAVMPGERLVP